MHSILSSFTRALFCIIAIASVAMISVGQETINPAVAPKTNLYRVNVSTGQIVSDTFVGTRLMGATVVATKGLPGWSLVGAADFGTNKRTGMVYEQASTGALVAVFYGDRNGGDPIGSSALAKLGGAWRAATVANLHDGREEIVFVNKSNGQVDILSYGGRRGTTLLGRETIGQLSATGWNLVGAANFSASARTGIILQNPTTRQVLVNFLGGPEGTTVTATQELAGDFSGWTAAGMQDMNGDGHPDLILFNDATGRSQIHHYGGSLGVTPLGTNSIDGTNAPGWKIVVPNGGTNGQVRINSHSQAQSQVEGDSQVTKKAQAVSVLIFNGTGTIANDVSAIESVVSTAGLAYHTANSSQLDAMSQSQLASYKLFIVPGGNSITIGNNLSSKATTNVRAAVQQSGMNYLGLCAGGFFGGFSKYYNGLDLTSGVWFSFYADYNKGIHKEPVHVSFPDQAALDIYWQNGPDVSGWGKVIARYPNGKAALAENFLGKGLVILSGVHPEAPASWRTGMNFKTPVDVDLAYAGTLVKAALNGTMLPHY